MPAYFPGERLIACRNPALAAERARKRTALLAATEADLASIAARLTRVTLHGAGRIGEAVGKVIGKRKVGKHFRRTITDTSLTYQRDQAAIDAEAALDGIYVLRTSVPASDLTPAGVLESYKNLAHVERDFRTIKTDDLDLWPIHHRLDERVRAHVLLPAGQLPGLAPTQSLGAADLHRRAPTGPRQSRRTGAALTRSPGQSLHPARRRR